MPTTPLLGRERELARLRDGLRRASGQSRLLFVTGAPGVGKSRLLDEFARLASRRGMVLVGRGSPFGATIPFGILSEALQAGLREVPKRRLTELIGDRWPELAPLIPAIASVAPPANGARGHLATLEAIVALLGAMAAGRPLVVELDDVHQADPSTWDLLGYAARNPLHAPILIVAASRPAGFADPLAAATRLNLVKDDMADELVVAPLDRRDVAVLAERTLGPTEGIDPGLTEWLFERARGNALFTVELLEGLREDPTRRVVPVSVKERVRASTLTMTAEARATIEIAAVLGHSFSLRTIGPLLPENAAGELDQLVRLRYLEERGEQGEAVLDFAHPLVQEAIYESLGPARRRDLHLEVMRRSHAAPIAERAYHAARGGLPGDEEPIDIVLEAARAAEGDQSHREAIVHLRAALDLLEATDPRRSRVLDEIAWQAASAADHETGIAALDELERTLPPDDQLALAGLEMRRASFLATGRADLVAAEREASDAARRLRDAGADDRLGGALTELAWIRGEGGDLDAQIEMSTEALDLVDGHGSDVAALHALGPLTHGLQLRGRIDETLAANERALDVAGQTRDAGQIGWHTGVRVETMLAAGRMREGAAIADALLETGNRSEVLRFDRARLNWYLGRWPMALEDCRTVIATLSTTPSLHAAWTLSLAALLETAMGDSAAGRPYLSQTDRLYGDRDFYVFSAWNDWAAGCALWLRGEPKPAHRRLSRAVHRADELRARTTLVQIIAEAVEVAMEAGFPDDARRMEELGRKEAEWLGDPLARAQAAFARAIVGPSAETFLAAADQAGTDLPFVRARALEHAARRLSGDSRRGALAEAVRLYAMLPAPGLRDRAATALRSEGPAGRRAAQGVGPLTAREREVAELAGRGAMTREIAERLHISERTVESHLAHVYAKLGVSGRKDLATLQEVIE